MQYDTKHISIIGAREHNLKDVSVSLPKNKFIVITGPSGSGKSSLALDVLYAEGQRRYMESLSSYARQFLGMPKKPDVDRIDGLCPSIAIDQKTVGHNPRSTVGTITEIYDYLRILYARVGKMHCPECGQPVQGASVEESAYMLLQSFEGQCVTLVAPVVRDKKGEFVHELERWFSAGHYRFIIDGTMHKFSSLDAIKKLGLRKTYRHTIDIVIDRCDVTQTECVRIEQAIERACALAGNMYKIVAGDQEHTFSTDRMCVSCRIAMPELEPRLFSFNSPLGACRTCSGLGSIRLSWREEKICSACLGKRLQDTALAVTVGGLSIYQMGELSIAQVYEKIKELDFDQYQQTMTQTVRAEIEKRLQFLTNVGLDYLSLNRTARTLSGGEGQRIRLARQLGSALSGVLYVLDEPSIGLHQKDNDQLIATLHKLRDQGNTVLVVEHDHDTMQSADYIVDMGPAAGVLGGAVVAHGTPDEIKKNSQSLTGQYLAAVRSIERLNPMREPQSFMVLNNACSNNLQDLTVQFPLGVLCGISGVSGSGKSSLIMHELVPALKAVCAGRRASYDVSKVTGTESIKNMVVIDQSPIGRTPRSNPATYLGIFDYIRALFASLPESNARGYKQGRFSFNVGAGRCAHCRGEGMLTISMHFMPDVHMMCKHCSGKRYNKQTLEITYKGKNIADILAMSAREAVEFFAAHTKIAKKIKLLCDVGLDYLTLGQSSMTLSGGEAQRIKLVNELAKRGSGTVYILDEPTTGLHAADIEKLLHVFKRLVDKGNTMYVIEHNLDVLKTVDYLIDLGPNGGERGGTIVAAGKPEEVAACAQSHTGKYLKKFCNSVNIKNN